jgi:hypothetical protein
MAVLILLGAMPYPARSDWTLGAEAHLRHDNNVGNAGDSADRVEDSIIGARLSMFRLVPIGESYAVSVGGDLSGESFHRLTGLSNASVRGTLALKRKWGLGAFAPWARAEVSIARSSDDDDYRSVSIYRAAVSTGRRLDERWNLWAEYAFERRAAATQEQAVPGISGDAFSQTQHRLALDAEYSLSATAFLSVALFGLHGDVVSTTLSDDGIYLASRAIAEDPTFGPNAYAYRLIGTTFGFRAGINYSPTPHTLLECGFQRLDTRAEGGNSYTKSMPEIALDYRF